MTYIWRNRKNGQRKEKKEKEKGTNPAKRNGDLGVWGTVRRKRKREAEVRGRGEGGDRRLADREGLCPHMGHGGRKRATPLPDLAEGNSGAQRGPSRWKLASEAHVPA